MNMTEDNDKATVCFVGCHFKPSGRFLSNYFVCIGPHCVTWYQSCVCAVLCCRQSVMLCQTCWLWSWYLHPATGTWKHGTNSTAICRTDSSRFLWVSSVSVTISLAHTNKDLFNAFIWCVAFHWIILLTSSLDFAVSSGLNPLMPIVAMWVQL